MSVRFIYYTIFLFAVVELSWSVCFGDLLEEEPTETDTCETSSSCERTDYCWKSETGAQGTAGCVYSSDDDPTYSEISECTLGTVCKEDDSTGGASCQMDPLGVAASLYETYLEEYMLYVYIGGGVTLILVICCLLYLCICLTTPVLCCVYLSIFSHYLFYCAEHPGDLVWNLFIPKYCTLCCCWFFGCNYNPPCTKCCTDTI